MQQILKNFKLPLALDHLKLRLVRSHSIFFKNLLLKQNGSLLSHNKKIMSKINSKNNQI